MTGRVSFEPLSDVDIDWVWGVYEATTREHIEQVVDWSEDEQREVRLEGLRRGSFEAIIDAAGERVGLVDVTDEGHELTIRHLEIMPIAQGRGIGSATMRAVIARAASAGKDLTLRVLHVNPRARALYERLGFVVDEERSHSTQMRLSAAAVTHVVRQT